MRKIEKPTPPTGSPDFAKATGLPRIVFDIFTLPISRRTSERLTRPSAHAIERPIAIACMATNVGTPKLFVSPKRALNWFENGLATGMSLTSRLNDEMYEPGTLKVFESYVPSGPKNRPWYPRDLSCCAN